MIKNSAILIIDDNPDDLEFYEDLLSRCKEKYKIYTAEDAEEGLKVFREKHIDCTLIDFDLPKKNGIQILQEITELSKGYAPTVILTGNTSQKIRIEAARNNALDFLRKDAHMTPIELESTIQKVMRWAKNLNAKKEAI